MKPRENFRPRLIRTVEIPDLAFRQGRRGYPAARVAKIGEIEGRYLATRGAS